jgi:lysozyme
VITVTDGARTLALKLIKRFEGCRLKAYQDGGGVWTVGYGVTSRGTGYDVGPGTVWTQEQADSALEVVLDGFLAGMAWLLTRQPTDNQMAALASLCFNIGIDAFRRSRVLRRYNAFDDAGCADAFLAWKYDNGKVVRGLVWRREVERAVFLGGEA